MRHNPYRQRLTARRSSDKPPKLRFKPGSFVKDKSGQIYQIRIAFRLVSEPNVWLFELEYRDDLKSPETSLSQLCAKLLGEESLNACPILWEPLRSGYDVSQHELCRNMYHYGDSKQVTNKDLLNNYTVISSGELNDLRS